MPGEAGEGRRRAAEADLEGESAARREQCPRCESRNTKFCYYNNYNTSQPRHFCKSCRRYWTLGGSLRNVPIGGASRKRFRTFPAAAVTAPNVPQASAPTVSPTSAAAIFRPIHVLTSISCQPPLPPPPLDLAAVDAPPLSAFHPAVQTGFLGIGEPFVTRRAGSGLGLGLGLGCGGSGSYPPSMADMGFGVGPGLLLPHSILDDRVLGLGDTWRRENGKGDCFAVPRHAVGGPIAWPRFAVPAQGGGGGGASTSELR